MSSVKCTAHAITFFCNHQNLSSLRAFSSTRSQDGAGRLQLNAFSNKGRDTKVKCTRSLSSGIGGSRWTGYVRGTRGWYVAASAKEYDVVIVGAGIIGLAIANSVLTETSLSVAILDAAQPCAGATGAGQGYIWLGHRQPGTAGWALASRSKQLWEQLVSELRSSGLDAVDALGWRNTGSLLVTSAGGEAEALAKKVVALTASGVTAEYLTASEACKREPSLLISDEGGAALVPGDSQIDAELAVNLLRQRNRFFSLTGRYQELFNEPVDSLICSSQDCSVEGVKTATRTIGVKEKVVIATGAWSSVFMSKLASKLNKPVVPPIKPRKGHLLVVEGFPHIRLNHALMEFEYSSNYAVPAGNGSACSPGLDDTIEVAMTLTTSQSGDLLLGSSREFKGFDVQLESNIVKRMFNRAATFFPALANLTSTQALQMGRVRIGLRPYCSDGTPIIGPIQGVPGLLIAAGHEGSGLCMSLGTAELILGMICPSKPSLDPSPYTPDGRLSSSTSN